MVVAGVLVLSQVAVVAIVADLGPGLVGMAASVTDALAPVASPACPAWWKPASPLVLVTKSPAQMISVLKSLAPPSAAPSPPR